MEPGLEEVGEAHFYCFDEDGRREGVHLRVHEWGLFYPLQMQAFYFVSVRIEMQRRPICYF